MRSRNQFVKLLRRIRRRWQMGLVVEALVRTAWCLVACSLVLAALDLFLAMLPLTRTALDLVVLSGLGLTLLSWLLLVLKRTDRDMARRADSKLHSSRRTVLSAYELDRWLAKKHDGADDLGEFLASRGIDRAVDALSKLPARLYMPVEGIGRQLRVLLLLVLVAGMVVFSNRQAAETVFKRFVFPGRDIPPYSNFEFEIIPEEPQVLYGGTVEMSARITGAPIRSRQVYCLVRYEGKVHRMACFQEDAEKFSQRLEKVVSPVEFCFTTGKARSKWRQVKVLLQPQVAVAAAVITPPAYSRCAPQQFFVGNEAFAGLKRSSAELRITSNRPLLDGYMTIRPRDGKGDERVVPAEKSGPQTVTFRWDMKYDADLDVVIRDLRGTPNGDPFLIRQQLIPDKPPEAVISSPSAFALATPRSTMPLAGYARDDLGIAQVDLVRGVVGYRDRTRTVGQAMQTKRFPYEGELRFADLGVEPGQVLEFYLEARDYNPSLMGVTASDIARVQIISEEEYGEMIRQRTTLEEFVARYRAVQNEMDRVKELLREIKEAADAGETERAIEARDKLLEQVEKAAKFYESLANDFAAFDIEEPLTDLLRQYADELREGSQPLAAAGDSPVRLARAADSMLKAIAPAQNKLEQQVQDAEEVAKVGRVMQAVGFYRSIVQRQSELVRRLNRFAESRSDRDPALLKSLAEDQKEIKESLAQFQKLLRERAEELPEFYTDLKSSALQFADGVDELEIPSFMDRASTAARNEDGTVSHREATVALERLEQLMSDPNSGGACGGLCQGNMKFQVPKDLKETLRQMLAAMMARPGVGSGSGGGMGNSPGTGMGMGPGGMGMGGNSGDGYFMQGHSPLNLPVFGPGRRRFMPPSKNGMTGSGRGAGGSNAVQLSEDDRNVMDVEKQDDTQSQSMPIEEIPEKYRDAVKRYFEE